MVPATSAAPGDLTTRHEGLTVTDIIPNADRDDTGTSTHVPAWIVRQHALYDRPTLGCKCSSCRAMRTASRLVADLSARLLEAGREGLPDEASVLDVMQAADMLGLDIDVLARKARGGSGPDSP